MAQKVLITGHTGYIGSVLVSTLLNAGYEVAGLDCDLFHGCSFEGSIPAVRSLWMDVRDVTTRDLVGFDAVCHLAAVSNDPLGDLHPEVTLEINHRATVNLARCAKAAGVRRFLFASSCSMYGAAGEDRLTERAPLNPITPYAQSKVLAEQELTTLADDDFCPIYLRNATAYGPSPRLRGDVVLNNLCAWAHTEGRIRILSDGLAWRPVVHVQDICNAFYALLEAPWETVFNQAFNIGSNMENHQVRTLAEFVREAAGGCDIEIMGRNNPDPRNYRVDFTKIERAVPSFRPMWTARNGARELVDAYRRFGLTSGQFQGRRFTRLAQLKYLLEHRRLSADLRWYPGREPWAVLQEGVKVAA